MIWCGKTAYFSQFHLKKASSQLNFHTETASNCNFNTICTDSAGFMEMPADFLNVMDYTLVSLNNRHCLPDDIFVVGRGTVESHQKLEFCCSKKFDADHLRNSQLFLEKYIPNGLINVLQKEGFACPRQNSCISNLKSTENYDKVTFFFVMKIQLNSVAVQVFVKYGNFFVWISENDTHFE